MQARLPPPLALDSGVTASFVVQKMFGSLLPPSPQLQASVRTGFCFDLRLIPIKELPEAGGGEDLPVGGGAEQVLEGAGGWVAGTSRNEGWEARRQSPGRGWREVQTRWGGGSLSRAAGYDSHWDVGLGGS